MTSNSATGAIELIKRIVADDTADLRERVQHLEQRTVGLTPIGTEPPKSLGDTDGEKAVEVNSELSDRLEKIKAIHRLDATPVQYTRDGQGRMVEAPEGLWEIQCVVCRDMPPVMWQKGDAEPPRCLTWRLADGRE